MSTPHETYRATLAARLADGSLNILIVTRQSGHRAGPVWLTLLHGMSTTVALTDDETVQLIARLTEAKAAR